MDVKITSPRPEFDKKGQQLQHQQLLIGGNGIAPPPYQPKLIDSDDDREHGHAQLDRRSTDGRPPLDSHDSVEGRSLTDPFIDYPIEKKTAMY